MTTTAPVDVFHWDAATYQQAADAGVFGHRRTEMVDGTVTFVAPSSAEHGFTEGQLRLLLSRLLDPQDWTVGGQSTVEVSSSDWPEPDVFVARGPRSRYSRSRPTSADLVLAAEVSRTSLVHDLEVKAPRYAMAGVPLCWVIDVGGRRAHVLSQPRPEGYAEHVVLSPADALRLHADAQELATVRVGDLLP